jgi:hypothetical protein
VGALIASLFGSISGFFALWMAKKTAFGIAGVAIFLGLTATLMAAITVAINTVLAVIPLPESYVFGFWYFMPENLPACASLVISAHVASAIYRMNVWSLQFVHNSA